MLVSSKAAHRYALALLELAVENKSVEKTLEDILLIQNTLSESRDLMLFLKSPIVKPEKKAEVLKAIFNGKISELVHRFVILIAKKGREDLLDQITYSFVDQYNKFSGIKEVEVRSARELNDNQISELKQSLEKYTGKKVLLNFQVIPELKGGLAVKIDDTVIDGTVKHKLEQLEEKFMQTAMV